MSANVIMNKMRTVGIHAPSMNPTISHSRKMDGSSRSLMNVVVNGTLTTAIIGLLQAVS